MFTVSEGVSAKMCLMMTDKKVVNNGAYGQGSNFREDMDYN